MTASPQQVLWGFVILASMGASLWFTVYPLISSLVILGGLVLAFFVFRPALMVYVLVLCLNLSYIMVFWTYRWDEVFLLPEFFLLVLIPLWYFSRGLGTADPYEGTPCDIPVLLFFSLAVCSLLWVTDDYSAAKAMVQLFTSLVYTFCIIGSVINTTPKLKFLLKLVIVIGVINGVVCFFSVVTFPDYPGMTLLENRFMDIKMMFNISFVGRRGHAMSHPLTTAMWLDFALIFATGIFLTAKSGGVRLLLAGTMFFLLCSLMTTLGKGPLLALMAGYVLMFLMLRPARKFYLSSLVLMAGTVIAAFAFSHITRLQTIINVTAHQLSGGDEGSSLSTRMEWWGIAWDKCMDTHGFGVGIGSLPQYLTMNAPHAHSVYFSALGELGVAGLALLIWIYVLALKTYLKALHECENEFYRRILLVYICGFVTVLSACFFDLSYTIFVPWWYVGLGFAIAKLAGRAAPGEMADRLPFHEKGRSMVSTDWAVAVLK